MKTLILFAFCIPVAFAVVELPPQAKCAAGDPPCDGVDNPCLNGGKCCMQKGKPVCDCSASTAYGGDYCHLCIKEACGFVDPCGRGVCQNGGTCTTLPLQRPYYRCACTKAPDGIPLYYGQMCQAKHICSHDHSVCKNEGKCTMTPNRCICAKNAAGVALFGGTFCTKPNPCADKPCFGDTECVFRETVGDHYCKCGNVRWGRNCEEVSACGDNTHECLNGGKCLVRDLYETVPKRYLCQCINDYACNRCQFKKACPNNLAGDKLCVRGTCRQACQKPDDGYCICPMGWGGVDCSEQLGAGCTATNDPHNVNFDGVPFEYHGTCDHIMTKTCVAAARWPKDVPVFQVTAAHRNCRTGGIEMGIACVHKIGIEIDGDHIELVLGSGKINVIVNGETPDVLPYLKESKNSDMNLVEIQVDQHSPLAQLNIETAWGLTVAASFNRVFTFLDLKLTRTLAGLLCGVCGPLMFNKKGFGGLTKPNKKFVETTLKFPLNPAGCDPYENGLQFLSANRKKRAIDEPVWLQLLNPIREKRAIAAPVFELKNGSVVCKTPEQLEKAKKLCSIINDPEGPFAPECLEKNEYRAQLYETCILDVCVNETFYCANLEMYAEVCGKVGPFKDWREVTGCGLFCLKNQQFKQGIIKRCSPSCKNKIPCPTDDPTMKVKKVFEEGCVCNEGLIWDSVSASCITEDQCGNTEPAFPKGFGQDEMCEFRGLKFLMGEARWDRCRKLCTCGTGGNWTCQNYRGYHCGPRECRDLNACLHRNVDFPGECDEKFVNHRLVFSEEYAEKYAHRVKRHAIPDEIIGGSLAILDKVMSRDLFNSGVSKHGGKNKVHEHQENESNDGDDDEDEDSDDHNDEDNDKHNDEDNGEDNENVGENVDDVDDDSSETKSSSKSSGKGKGNKHSSRGNHGSNGNRGSNGKRGSNGNRESNGKRKGHGSKSNKSNSDSSEEGTPNDNANPAPQDAEESTEEVVTTTGKHGSSHASKSESEHGSGGKSDGGRGAGHREDLRFLMKHVIIVVDSEHVEKCEPI